MCISQDLKVNSVNAHFLRNFCGQYLVDKVLCGRYLVNIQNLLLNSLVLLIPAVTKMVQHTQLLTNREMLQDNVAGQLQISKYSMLIVRTQ